MRLHIVPEQGLARRLAIGALFACMLGIGACSDLELKPSPLSSSSPDESSYVLTSEIHVRPVGGSNKTLNAGTVVSPVGTIAQGKVYKLRTAVLTADAHGNAHEAYLVVQGNDCVGVWLPFEQSFVALSAATPIQLTKGGQQ